MERCKIIQNILFSILAETICMLTLNETPESNEYRQIGRFMPIRLSINIAIRSHSSWMPDKTNDCTFPPRVLNWILMFSWYFDEQNNISEWKLFFLDSQTIFAPRVTACYQQHKNDSRCISLPENHERKNTQGKRCWWCFVSVKYLMFSVYTVYIRIHKFDYLWKYAW